MKIIIQNESFDYDFGCRLLKAKYGDTPFNGLEDIWADIVPPTFQEVLQNTPNVETRRVAINCLGIDKIAEQLNSRLVSEETIEKTTMWVNEKGELAEHKFSDTYSLYAVNGEDLFKDAKTLWGRATHDNAYYISCKDTSTDRRYLLWVDLRSVNQVKFNDRWFKEREQLEEGIDAIDCIAWTITTNVPEGSISHIIRQGDCILVKPKKNALLGHFRHLTAEEYRNLLLAES